MEKPKKWTGKTAFKQRLILEGRDDELHAKCKQLVAEGMTGIQAYAVAREQMGFQGDAKEIQMAKARGLLSRTEVAIEEYTEKRNISDLEEAILTLPPRAPKPIENDWIAGHPAMNRFDLLTDKTKEVRITADDVLRPPHGKAPSQAAVRALIHWVRSPHEFYKNDLIPKNKPVEQEKAKRNIHDADESLDEVRKLLVAFQKERQSKK